MSDRFVGREMTVQEAIWLDKGQKGDYESLIMFLESRRVDPEMDIRGLPVSQVIDLIKECAAVVEFGPSVSDALNKLGEELT